jgi:hypothetical protein
VPIEPDAPGLFSTMNCCPSSSLSLVPSSRASGSTEPPGGNGTTSLTGFVGHCCAAAGRATAATRAKQAARISVDSIGFPLLTVVCGD